MKTWPSTWASCSASSPPCATASTRAPAPKGIEEMGREEAAYWLGMAMHRKHPRRVLMALRFLLIDPKA